MVTLLVVVTGTAFVTWLAYVAGYQAAERDASRKIERRGVPVTWTDCRGR